MNLSEFVITSKLKSVPLVNISTHDQFRTAEVIRSALVQASKDGKFDYKDAKTGKDVHPKIFVARWDMTSGARMMETGEKGYPELKGETEDPIVFFGGICQSLPEMSTVVALSGQQLTGDARVIQAMMNLRDVFKENNRTLILVGPSFDLPPELRDCFMPTREPLPTLDELKKIVSEACAGAIPPAAPSDEELGKAAEVLRGMSAFVAEQTVALSICEGKLHLETLWDLKKEYVRSIRALEWLEGTTTFDDLGGLDGIKEEIRMRFQSSRFPPNGIVFIDEFEKSAPSEKDDHEATRDLHGVLLGELNKKQFIMALGVPGSGKTALALACQKTFGVPVLKLDLGSTRGKGLYGQAQNEIRDALELVNEIMGGNPLYVVTCNDVNILSGPLRNRVENTFFFDLPTEEQRMKIWEIYSNKWPDVGEFHGLDHEGWNGRNIEQCAFRAYNYRIPLPQASEAITPVGVFARERIERLRDQATDNGYLDANTGKRYKRPEGTGASRRSLG